MVEVVSMGDEVEGEICRRFANRIHAYGLRHLRDATAAQDLVQLVLVAVLEALREGRVEEPARLDAYVLGACRNATMAMRRGEARRRRLADAVSALDQAAYEPSWTRIDRLRLEHCIRALPPRDRAIVVATFLEDADAVDIATTLNLSPGNVRVIRHRALARLLVCVEGGEA